VVGDDDHGVEAGSRAAHEAVEVSLSAGVIVVLLALLCVAADCGFRSATRVSTIPAPAITSVGRL